MRTSREKQQASSSDFASELDSTFASTFDSILPDLSSKNQNKNQNKNKNQNPKRLSPKYYPKTANQKIYCECLSDPNASIVLGVGPAGTGKTLFACTTAIHMLNLGEIHKIILTRPVVAVEEELGFLPGDMVSKMDPWTRPIFDVFLEYYTQKEIDFMIQSGTIEISPLAYMRGRTFKRSFIIADEMQNSSPNQMLMLITRIGENTKMVITGDLKQSDRTMENGLRDFMRKLYSRNSDSGTKKRNGNMVTIGGIRAVELDLVDVERSAIVKQVLALYEPLPTYTIEPDVNNSSCSWSVSNSSDTSSTSTFEDYPALLNDDGSALLNDDGSALVDDGSALVNDYLYLTNEDNRNVITNDAALIPKEHTSKYFSGENYETYRGKWSGW